MEKYSFAKINLALDVIKKRLDNYHEIDGIMQLISLYDKITVNFSNEFEITSNNEEIPLDEKNLVYKAYKILKENFVFNKSFSVHIEKNIPVTAGLAGGTSNCHAFFEMALNMLAIDILKKEKIKLLKPVGADITYFFSGKTCRATGIGDKINFLKPLKKTNVLIVNNGDKVETDYCYKNITCSNSYDRMNNLILDYQTDTNLFFKNIYNTMEEVAIKKSPSIKKIKEDLINLGAVNSLMTGSGPTVFAIFEDCEKFNSAYLKMKKKYELTFKTTTLER